MGVYQSAVAHHQIDKHVELLPFLCHVCLLNLSDEVSLGELTEETLKFVLVVDCFFFRPLVRAFIEIINMFILIY